MIARTGRRLALPGLTLSLLAVIWTVLTPAPAAACDVSYRYRPTIRFGANGFGDSCSTGTSLSAVAVVLLVLSGVLVVLALRTLRQGKIEAATLAPPTENPPGNDPAEPADRLLQSYLASLESTTPTP